MKMIKRAIIATGMEMPMPAFAPAVNFFVVGLEVVCVIEFEVDVTIGELLVEMLADCSVEVFEGVNSSNASEANSTNIVVSVVSQATGTPSHETVTVGATSVNAASLAKPPEGQSPVGDHTFVKVVVATL